jgi:hypothetical protein
LVSEARKQNGFRFPKARVLDQNTLGNLGFGFKSALSEVRSDWLKKLGVEISRGRVNLSVHVYVLLTETVFYDRVMLINLARVWNADCEVCTAAKLVVKVQGC